MEFIIFVVGISWSRLQGKKRTRVDDVYFICARGTRQRHSEIISRDDRKKFRVTAMYYCGMNWIRN